MDFDRWFGDALAERPRWFAKRLSANDVGASGSNQVGLYLSRRILFALFPGADWPSTGSPSRVADLFEPQTGITRTVRFTWYNSKNEGRVTRFGGPTGGSPLQDPDNTGALTVFVQGKKERFESWVCTDLAEEEFLTSLIGPVDPGQLVDNFAPAPTEDRPCAEAPIPEGWRDTFPTISETVRLAATLLPLPNIGASARLMRRRNCEFEIFRFVELAHHEQDSLKGFETFNSFLTAAQTVLQRRKARSGRSLELHLKLILDEEGLVEGQHYDSQVTTEGRKTPDFLFPSGAAYSDPSFDEVNLRMLAVKTTAKDRWRQVLDEAERIPTKHLFTLQEGMTEHQFEQIRSADLRLVIPRGSQTKFPAAIRPHLIILEDFIEEVRALGSSTTGLDEGMHQWPN